MANYLSRLHDLPQTILRGTLLVTAAMLLAAIALKISASPLTLRTYDMMAISSELFTTSPIIFLEGAVCALLINRYARKHSL